jgi:hypothetical protein
LSPPAEAATLAVMPLRDDRAELLRRYLDGTDAVRKAVEGLTDAQLDQPAADDPANGWTARQVVHHLADSEMTSAIRLRRLLAEDAPVIAAYDENAFARRLHYDDRPIDDSLDAMAAARATSAQILERLSDEEWERAGTHTESGRYSVDDWLRIYADHGEDHAEQIRRAVGDAR